MTDRNQLLDVRAVSYRVRDAVLVSEASLSVAPGEIVAVLGPNGAGKSTLLRLAAGDLESGSGSVRVVDEELGTADPATVALKRAVLPQRFRTDVPFTVAAVVAMGRFPHRAVESNTPEVDQAAVAEAMALTDVTRLATRIFATLSGGEQSRASLARVLAQQTPLLLLDEPTTNLDIGHQEQMLRTVRDLARTGRGILIVLHDLNAAAAYADRVAVMGEGRIVAEGAPADVYDERMFTELYHEPMRVIPHPLRDGPLVLPG